MTHSRPSQLSYHDTRMAPPVEPAATLWQHEAVLWKSAVLFALAYLLWCDKISIVLGPLHDTPPVVEAAAQPVRASIFDLGKIFRSAPEAQAVNLQLPPSALNNVTFALDPAFAKRNGVARQEVEERQAHCLDYVKRFGPVAVAEMRRSGIPASITLAQGLLESDAGQSALARKANNHFGIKCFSKRCKRGHCTNFADDSHKDFFLKYDNTWASFRAHTEFLRQTARYRALFSLPGHDYRAWAHGLQRAGYATDPQYADKLIALVESLDLAHYDGL